MSIREAYSPAVRTRRVFPSAKKRRSRSSRRISAWTFSAGIRYGRSHANRHKHKQGAPPPSILVFYATPTSGYVLFSSLYGFLTAPIADAKTSNAEQHVILDFEAGRDVGIGLFGRNGSSTLSAGVRAATFDADSAAYITGRPEINVRYFYPYGPILPFPYPTFHQYTMHADAARSFKGIGPELSWDASAALAGNSQDGELTFDWGINAALLFGKQKAKTEHRTSAFHLYDDAGYNAYIGTLYPAHGAHSTRSRNVTVPNIGGYAGLSVKYTDVKVSIGYRYDTFLNAMDTGIDAAKKSNLTFNGPFATISIGIGD